MIEGMSSLSPFFLIMCKKGMHDPKGECLTDATISGADLHDHNGRELTLPTETWREYVDRSNRCLELRNKLVNGEVSNINDFITYNLNILQFAQDVHREL